MQTISNFVSTTLSTFLSCQYSSGRSIQVGIELRTEDTGFEYKNASVLTVNLWTKTNIELSTRHQLPSSLMIVKVVEASFSLGFFKGSKSVGGNQAKNNDRTGDRELA